MKIAKLVRPPPIFFPSNTAGTDDGTVPTALCISMSKHTVKMGEMPMYQQEQGLQPHDELNEKRETIFSKEAGGGWFWDSA